MLRLVDESVEQYCLDHSDPETDIYARLRKETYETMEIPQMIAGQLVGSFLQMLIRSADVKRIVEVGTFTGYSTLKMAEALGDDGRVDTFEYEEAHATFAQRYFDEASWGNRITLHRGAALDNLPNVNGPIDLSFIDADKVNYVNYYNHLVELTRPGGIIVLDNALWSGKVLAPEDESDHALNEMNKFVHQDARVNSLLLPVRDGLMVAQKKG